jgi:hypothetical protein
MKNNRKFNCPCWIQNDLSDEAAYEIHIFLSNLAWEFLNRHYDQIDQHEQGVGFMEENNTFIQNVSSQKETLPF